MTTVTPSALLPPSRVQSPSFIRKRDLPTPPPSLSDVNDSSSSCSSSSSYSTSASLPDSHPSVPSCDLLHILTDARFRPVFQAIEEIKRRKCRPDLERILKYVEKRSLSSNLSYQREEIVVILDDLLKYGLISKVFHKGGFTIRIKNEKYAKLIENMNICYNQKTPTATPMNAHEAMAAALATGAITANEQPWSLSKPYILNSTEMNSHIRETPSPEFAGNDLLQPFVSLIPPLESSPSTIIPEKFHLTKENNLTSAKKRPRNATPSPGNSRKRTRPTRLSEPLHSSSPLEHVFLKPFIVNQNLPPVTIEQLLGLRGDIPDVHNWTTDHLIAFFHQQGYEYAAIILAKHQINGNQLYELKREQVFRMSTLKIGKSLKLWNVIEQIQRNNPLSTSSSK